MMEIAKVRVHATDGICLNTKRIPAGIVGATVSIDFADPIWDRLQKIVVFKGNDTRIAVMPDPATAVIPAECVCEPGPMLSFGLYGYDPDTGFQLPLIMVSLAAVVKATEPDADPGTDPTLPVWAQLDARVSELEKHPGGGADEDEVRRIVQEYLAETGAVGFETDETLTLKDGILSVNTAKAAEADNTLPITSAAVHTQLGNIEVLLKTI